MERKRKESDDMMAMEIAFMMGKNGDDSTIREKLIEMQEEYGCFSY